MINDLNWQTPEQRRNISAVTYLHKIQMLTTHTLLKQEI
jgi:hypothetical protein